MRVSSYTGTYTGAPGPLYPGWVKPVLVSIGAMFVATAAFLMILIWKSDGQAAAAPAGVGAALATPAAAPHTVASGGVGSSSLLGSMAPTTPTSTTLSTSSAAPSASAIAPAAPLSTTHRERSSTGTHRRIAKSSHAKRHHKPARVAKSTRERKHRGADDPLLQLLK